MILGIILAGYGNRLYPLADDSPQGIPKALLPIANCPMISYTLTWMETNGISEIIVIANSKISCRLANYIHKQYSLVHEGTKIEVHSTEGYPGTVQLMRGLKDRVKSNVFVCSCDIIPGKFSLDPVFDLFRKHNADLVAIFYPKPASSSSESSRASVAASSEDYCDVIGLVPGLENRLLFFASDTDLEEHLSIGMDLLHRYGMLEVSSAFADGHAYLISKSSFEALCSCTEANNKQSSSLFSIKEDWIPSIVRTSKCFAYLSPPGECSRVNTLSSYLEINKAKAKDLPEEERFPQSSAAPPQIHPKSQIGMDCVMIGEGSVIEEKASIKKSIIGTGVRIGPGVKITNSIIMDHVVIEGNCKLDGVIVAWKATIREKCNLKDCDIGASVTVERETIAKGDCFTDGMHEDDGFE